MPDPGRDTLQHRLRVLEGRLSAVDARFDELDAAICDLAGEWFSGNVDDCRGRVSTALSDALAELRSLERAVAERPELSGTRLSHGETP